MKYIRTKNGKIHISYNDYQGFEKLWVCEKRNTLADFYYVRRSSIVAQADTIEELCDEFVLFRDGKPYAILRNEDDNATKLKETWKDYRGAIWADKGLIYVAKMNEKGELKLL